MTDYAALCASAGLSVQAVETVGAQVCVVVAPLTVTPETVVRRLGRHVTLSFGTGQGNIILWFMREGKGEHAE